MPSRRAAGASARQFKPGDTIGVAKAARGNSGADWLEAEITSIAPGGFYDYEVEYRKPPTGNLYRRVAEVHCVPWDTVKSEAAGEYMLAQAHSARRVRSTSALAEITQL